jgi:octaprenyl-diphosphate synthase
MKNYQKEALTILSEFPDSDAKNSLELLVDYVINRKK